MPLFSMAVRAKEVGMWPAALGRQNLVHESPGFTPARSKAKPNLQLLLAPCPWGAQPPALYLGVVMDPSFWSDGREVEDEGPAGSREVSEAPQTHSQGLKAASAGLG